MCIAAADELAKVAEDKGLDGDTSCPTMDEWEVFPREAVAVAMKAIEQGIALRTDLTFEQEVAEATAIIARGSRPGAGRHGDRLHPDARGQPRAGADPGGHEGRRAAAPATTRARWPTRRSTRSRRRRTSSRRSPSGAVDKAAEAIKRAAERMKSDRSQAEAGETAASGDADAGSAPADAGPDEAANPE